MILTLKQYFLNVFQLPNSSQVGAFRLMKRATKVTTAKVNVTNSGISGTLLTLLLRETDKISKTVTARATKVINYKEI